jgi:4-diphosphocytidyl-2-C-methyl-D-erythritol kinase
MKARALAPAKINLSLKVGRVRADGRHDLESIVAFADFGDVVEAEFADALTLDVTGPFAAALAGETDNLVLRAARTLAAAGGLVSPAARLVLEKNLPIASGVGGGSSDAAAALKALNELWRLGASLQDLAVIGRALGADVPVCVAARAALMRGAGEIVEPIALPTLHAVLANPRAPLSTADVYRVFDAMRLGADIIARPAPFWPDGAAAIAGLAALGNDLAAPARSLAPSIAEIESLLAADPRARLVRLSGSGATVFALTDDREAAAAFARDVEVKQDAWWVRAVRLNAG